MSGTLESFKSSDGFSTPAIVAALLLTEVVLPEPVLDLGCGTGALMGHLRDRGYTKVYGLENDPSRYRRARSMWGGRVIHGDLDTVLPDMEFGTVITSPPMGKAQDFLDRALQITGNVVMLVTVAESTRLSPQPDSVVSLPFPVSYSNNPHPLYRRWCIWKSGMANPIDLVPMFPAVYEAFVEDLSKENDHE